MTAEKNTVKNDELLEEEKNGELTEEESVEEAAVEEAEPIQMDEDPEKTAERLLELKNQNSLLEKKLEEYENRYLRLQADFDNSRRRSRMETEANEKYRAQKLIIDILPSLDNFERALKMESVNEQSSALLQGMEMVYRGLLDALSKEGLQAIEAVGKEFDPHLHQAVMQGEDANFGSNIVIEEFQKGYMLKDRVIRPSMVKVNQ